MRRIIPVAVSVTLLAGCATLQFIPPPVPTIDFLGSDDFIVTQPYRYEVGSSGQSLDIPAGFVTDYASILPGLRWLLPRQGQYSRAAVIHDYLYWSQICTKPESDNILLIAMKELHVPGWKRTMIYEGVSRGGQGAWDADRAERLAGKPKFVPQQYYRLAATLTWPQARQELIRAGVHDPALPPKPKACALGNGNIVP